MPPMPPLTPPTLPTARPAASMRVVLGLTFVNSLGTGAVTNGVFFIASQSLGFGRNQNFLLGAALGATYITGALAVGPLLRRLITRTEAVTHRRVVGALAVLLGLLCFLPWLVIGGQPPGSSRGSWALWVFTLAYSPLTGALWPIIESYLAGGRRGETLRNAIGRFNICWALAIPAAYWGMAPLLEHHSLLVLNGLGVFHVLSLALVWWLPATPARHVEDDHEKAPAVYRPLLALCRVLLPMSYLIFSVWTPYQPTALAKLGVAVVWQTPVAATWHISRAVVFGLLGSLQGWHGKWWLPLAGAGALVLGLVGSLAAPAVGAERGGLVLLIGSLACFGCGIGAIYAAALYYAMSVGDAEVDAGGKHEALIGIGYTLGPALGLAAGLAADAKWFPLENGFAPLLMGSVLLVCVVVGVWAAWWVPRTARQSRS